VTRSETRGAKEAGNKRFENSAFKERIKTALRRGIAVAHGLGRMMVTMSGAVSIGRGIDSSVRAIAPCSYATAPDVGRTLARDQPPEWTSTSRGAVAKGPGTWRDRRPDRIFTPAKEPSKPPDRVNSFRSRSAPRWVEEGPPHLGVIVTDVGVSRYTPGFGRSGRAPR
jgi:hypothetical protein